jgi:hypothetical protein
MPFIDVKPLDEIYPKETYIEYIQGNIGNYRVYDPEAVLPKNHSIVYKIPEINGYEATALQSYEGFLGENTGYLGFDANPVSASTGISNLGSKLDMLGVKYILTSSMLEEDGLRRVFSDSGVNIYENLNVLPVAYMVPCAETAVSSEEIINLLNDTDVDFSQEILIEEAPPHVELGNGKGNYETIIKERSPGRITIESSSSTAGFLFLSEAWYPAWKVYIDGQPGETIKANGAFMATYLEPGEHIIKFSYQSTFFKAGAAISLTTLVLLALMVIFQVKKHFPNRPKSTYSKAGWNS